jgi:hypothetical protein
MFLILLLFNKLAQKLAWQVVKRLKIVKSPILNMSIACNKITGKKLKNDLVMINSSWQYKQLTTTQVIYG